ncbi:MAG: hypothetical protein WKF84_20860 [Pyrinomonadaceae bacterium]
MLQLTENELVSLRGLVQSLKEGGSDNRGLCSAVERFVHRFNEETGINVQVTADSDLIVSDRLAAEVFQLVAEALSNIRRHTQATEAFISMICRNHHFILQVWNKRGEGVLATNFRPRSICERSESLGGQCRVLQSKDGSTHLHISIPL